MSYRAEDELEEIEQVSPEVIKPVPLEEVKVEEKKEEIKEGRAAKKWSVFFFVMSVILLALVAGTIVLPIIIFIFGLLSVMCWLCFILFTTVFTLGMIWLVDGIKEFNHGWMDFNEMLFTAGNSIYEKVIVYVPYLIGVGSVFFLITWLFMILGRCKDKNRKKYYTGMIIASSVLTVMFIAVSIITMIAHNNV